MQLHENIFGENELVCVRLYIKLTHQTFCKRKYVCGRLHNWS